MKFTEQELRFLISALDAREGATCIRARFEAELSQRKGWLSIHEHPPVTAGWYATLHSWDSSEGSFPSVHHWTGTEWAQPQDGPIVERSPEPFGNAEDAEVWATENDRGD